VNIRAQNSFWNKRTKRYEAQKNFSLIDDVTIDVEPPGRRGQSQLPLSSFKWGDEIYESLISGYIRTIDTQLALSLRLPISMRLFRYLDKKRHGNRSFEIGLRRLCEVHLGMTSSRYESKYKERLDAAHTELLERQFLASVEYLPMAN